MAARRRQSKRDGRGDESETEKGQRPPPGGMSMSRGRPAYDGAPRGQGNHEVWRRGAGGARLRDGRAGRAGSAAGPRPSRAPAPRSASPCPFGQHSTPPEPDTDTRPGVVAPVPAPPQTRRPHRALPLLCESSRPRAWMSCGPSGGE